MARVFIIAVFLAAFISSWFAVASALAQPGDPLFTVSGIKVDVTADSALAARTKAFEEAQVQAFAALADRLLPEEDSKNFETPPIQTISTLIDDFEVTNERLSKVRYIGTYTFRFRDQAVKKFFAGRNVAYADVRSRTILILPVYEENGSTVLWGEERNPWLSAWGRTDGRQGLVPVQVPIGDAADVSDIPGNRPLQYSDESLRAMLARYGTAEAIIVLAKSIAPNALDVAIYRTDRGVPEFVRTVKVGAADLREGETVFDAGVRIVRKALQSDWKSRTIVQPDGGIGRLQARVRFSSLREWAETQKALSRVPGVNEVKLIAFTPRAARVELAFSGGEDRLRLALAQADMTLSAPQVDFNQEAQAGAISPLVYDLYLNRYGN